MVTVYTVLPSGLGSVSSFIAIGQNRVFGRATAAGNGIVGLQQVIYEALSTLAMGVSGTGPCFGGRVLPYAA